MKYVGNLHGRPAPLAGGGCGGAVAGGRGGSGSRPFVRSTLSQSDAVTDFAVTLFGAAPGDRQPVEPVD
ncbi:MAG TPA: hypothetical protein VLT34_05580 [Arthrobacter sp.]|nr:hypothetical protein [Arthrobacter sp.]